MTTTAKDPLHIPQTLANGPIFMGRAGEMHILTFTQVITRADEMLVGSASNPSQEAVVICRIAMTNQVLRELISTLNQGQMAAVPTAGNA
jgi:hypothetical protein